VETILEGLPDLGRLALAEQAVVDEDALELRADRLVQQQRDHRAVHRRRKARRSRAPADLFADLLDRFLSETSPS